MGKFRRRDSAPICKCGHCNKKTKWSLHTKKYNRFLPGHQNRKNNYVSEPPASKAPFCGCNCGDKVTWCKQRRRWNKYLPFHHIRINNPMNNPESRKKIGRSGKENAMFGKPGTMLGKFGKEHPAFGIKRSKEFCDNLSKTRKGDKNSSKRPEVRKKISDSIKALGDNNVGRRPEVRKIKSKKMKAFWAKNPIFRQQKIQKMLNGQAAYMNSFIRNPSRPQVELFELVKSIYPQAILNYPSLNKSIDIAIPDKWIAIEYDGSYWHDAEKDKIRQKKLENIGWKFLRYMDYIPTIDELINNLNKLEV